VIFDTAFTNQLDSSVTRRNYYLRCRRLSFTVAGQATPCLRDIDSLSQRLLRGGSMHAGKETENKYVFKRVLVLGNLFEYSHK